MDNVECDKIRDTGQCCYITQINSLNAEAHPLIQGNAIQWLVKHTLTIGWLIIPHFIGGHFDGLSPPGGGGGGGRPPSGHMGSVRSKIVPVNLGPNYCSYYCNNESKYGSLTRSKVYITPYKLHICDAIKNVSLASFVSMSPDTML